MAGKPTSARGLSTPMRAFAWSALLAGCAFAAPRFALAQDLQLPTILRPGGVTPEVIDGPDPMRLRRLRPEAASLPRTKRTPANPARRSVRPDAPGAEAAHRVEPAPLRRGGPPQLTPPPPLVARRRPPEIDPFAPVGFDAGGLVIRPALDLDGGYDSNPNRLRGAARGSTFVRPGAEIRVDSNWSTHGFQGLLRGSYSHYATVEAANRPEIEARGSWRFDVTRSTTLAAETRFRLDTQSPQTTDLPFITSGRPLVWQFGGTLGAEHKINRVTVGLRGTVDRYAYDDAKLPGGAIVEQGDRNYNQFGAALRLGYELTPGVRPFVEAKIDERLHDRRVDSAGYARNSVGLGARVGTTVEIGRTLVGEVSAGYEKRKYDDPRLSELRGLVGDASLIWSATPLTTIGLRAQTTLDETTTPGVAGAVARKGVVEIAHAFLRNVVLTGTSSFQRTSYQGTATTEDTMTGTVRLDYKLSRTLAVRASYTHERLKSSAPGSDYTANIFMVGLRLQR